MQVDAKPYILEDNIGQQLIAPPDDWQQRPDMKFTKRLRASMVARSRFIEDFVIEKSKEGMASMSFSAQDSIPLPNAGLILHPDFRYTKLINPIRKPGNDNDSLSLASVSLNGSILYPLTLKYLPGKISCWKQDSIPTSLR